MILFISVVSTSAFSASSDADSSNSSDCNLVITISGNEKVKVGDEFDLKITVKNSLNEAENVVVDGSFFDDFEVVSVKQSKGDYIYEIDEWDVGDLKDSESATLTLKVKAKKEGKFTHTAEVTTDSNNLNKKDSKVKTDIEVVAKEDPKKPDKPKNDTQQNNQSVNNQSADNQSAQTVNQSEVQDNTNHGIDLNGLAVPIGIVVVALLAVGGLFLRRRSK